MKSLKVKFGIRKKLTIFIGILLFVGFLICGISINSITQEKIEIEIVERVKKTSEAYAIRVKLELTKTIDAAISLGKIYAGYEEMPVKERREFFTLLLRNALESSSNSYSVWTIWEPNALDYNDAEYTNTTKYGKTGQYNACWSREENGEIIYYPLSDSTEENWYTKPLHSDIVDISDPEIDQDDLEKYGQRTLIYTISIPIKNKAGQAVGVLGFDVKINNLKKLLITDLYNTGFSELISTSGKIITSPKNEKIGTELEHFNRHKDFYDKVAQSNETNLLVYKENGTKMGVASTPLFFKEANISWFGNIIIPYDEIYVSVDHIITRLVIILALVFILVLVMLNFIINPVLLPLNVTVNTLKNIAQGDGDLTVRLPVKGNDEITDLSQYFNQTIAKIGNTIHAVKENAKDLNDVGQELSSNMTETATSVNQISANIEGVKSQVMSQATGVTETSATMEEIMRTIQQLDLSITKQMETVQDLIGIINDSNVTTEETRNILNKNDELIAELVEESSKGQTVVSTSQEEVNKIIEESGSLMEASSIIQNIASQTNLLAMNAAIEAAHAGDSGKGFAVVADEIRKLAEESSAQGKMITASLKNLGNEIQTISASSINIGESFTSMSEKVNQVKLRSAGIMKIAQTRKEQSEKLLKLVQSVDEVTAEVKGGSAEMLQGGQQVAEEMQKLDDLTRVITDSMNEMASGAVQINNAVQEVNKMSAKNKESIEDLTDEISKFKT